MLAFLKSTMYSIIYLEKPEIKKFSTPGTPWFKFTYPFTQMNTEIAATTAVVIIKNPPSTVSKEYLILSEYIMLQ